MDTIAKPFTEPALTAKEKRQAYNARPDVKARNNKLLRLRRATPEGKANRKEYRRNGYIKKQVRSAMDDLIDTIVINACLEEC